MYTWWTTYCDRVLDENSSRNSYHFAETIYEFTGSSLNRSELEMRKKSTTMICSGVFDFKFGFCYQMNNGRLLFTNHLHIVHMSSGIVQSYLPIGLEPCSRLLLWAFYTAWLCRSIVMLIVNRWSTLTRKS